MDAHAMRAGGLRLAVPAATAVITIGAVAAELAASTHPFPAPVGGFVLGLVTSAALLWRSIRPSAVTAAVLLISLGYHLVGYPGQGPALALFVACFSLAAAARTPWGAVAGIGIALVWSAIPAVPPFPTIWWGWPVLGPAIGIMASSVAGAVAGLLAREASARRAAESAEERVRIARDMHDVIAHTLTAVTVQTTVALDAIDDDPAAAREALQRARALSIAAAPQLRTSLHAFRSGTAPTAPQPTLALVDEVLAAAEVSGLAVDRELAVGPGALPPVTELALARIVQEAVTNTVRHSGAQRLRVTLQVTREEARLEIVDDGRHTAGIAGLGIGGMRERAELAGGHLDAGPVVGGGFRVAAVLPIRGAA